MFPFNLIGKGDLFGRNLKNPQEVHNSTGLPVKFHMQDCHCFYLIKSYHSLLCGYKALQESSDSIAKNNLISSDKGCLFWIPFESLRITGTITAERRLLTLSERDSCKFSSGCSHMGLQIIQLFIPYVTDTPQKAMLLGKKD